MNALYGLYLPQVRGQGMILQHLNVQNCGTAALGGEDIKIGGNTFRRPVGYYISNLATNYDEGIYSGPAGGSGPTSPANGIEF